MDDYLTVRPRLYPPHDAEIESMRPWAERQNCGDAVVWITFEGRFWFPRTLMNIERQMYAFYDQPELIHRINQDLADFRLRTLRKIAKVCVPTFMMFAENMSYNHGAMISRSTKC